METEEKVREIEKALAATRSAESIERISYLAHQLKGSGGSYGFQGISTHAAALEKSIEADGDELDANVRKHVDDLRAEIEARTRELAVTS